MAAVSITSGENAVLNFGLYDLPEGDTWRGEWSGATDYVTADAVFHGAVAYEATGPSTNEEPPDTDWTALSTAIAADDVQSVLVELIDSTGKVRVNWSYAIVGDELTSGTLVVGARYRIKLYVPSDDFANVGAASNTTGEVFIATSATPTTWTNSSVLQQIDSASNIRVSDGLVEVELLAQNTVNLDDTFEARISVAQVDNVYFGSGAQSAVLCLEDVILISPC